MLAHGRLSKEEFMSVTATQIARKGVLRTGEELRKELRKTSVRITEIMADYRDPQRSLQEKIRLNIRRGELEAYATGLRYALGGVPKEQFA